MYFRQGIAPRFMHLLPSLHIAESESTDTRFALTHQKETPNNYELISTPMYVIVVN